MKNLRRLLLVFALIPFGSSAVGQTVADTVTITITAPVEPVDSLVTVTIRNVQRELEVGDSLLFWANTLDQGGDPIAAELRWFSSDPTALTIDSLSGWAHALAAVDSVSVIARATWDPGSPPPTGEPIASDNFDRPPGLYNHWLWTTGSGARHDTTPNGTLGARFTLGPNLPGEDAMAELRYDLTPVNRSSEIWFEAFVWVPPNHRTRSDGGPDKFFWAWGSGDYPGGGARTSFALNLNRSATSAEHRTMSLFVADNDHVMKSSWAIYARDFITPGQLGTWQRLRIHARLGLGGGTEPGGGGSNGRNGTGLVEVWWGADKIIDVADLSWDPVEERYLQKGYLMGWSNMGYTEATSWYWDNIEFYISDPGW